MTLHLGFGCNEAVPDDAQAAWGARFIVTQDGSVDIVWDRTDAVGDDTPRGRLLDFLNQRYTLSQLRDDVSARLIDRRIRTREAELVTLYEDDEIIVAGNSNASAGYFYVSAVLKAGA